MWPLFYSPCLEDRAHGPCDFCLKLFLKAFLHFAIVWSSNSSKPSRTKLCLTIWFVKEFLFSRNMLFACVVHIRRPLKTAEPSALRQDLGFLNDWRWLNFPFILGVRAPGPSPPRQSENMKMREDYILIFVISVLLRSVAIRWSFCTGTFSN